jgi:iron complex transport system substrate-binding protein
MKNLWRIPATLMVCLLLCGCASIRLTDSLGTAIELSKPATRIISLAPSNTELLFAVGAGSQIVGRDDLSNFPVDANRIPNIGSTFQAINTEAVVALQPDLVLAAETTTPEQIHALTRLGLTVYRLKNPKDFEGLFANIATVGELTGHQKTAATLAESLRTRMATVDKKVSGASARPKVFYEIDATDPTKPWTAGPGSFVDMLVVRAGGLNIGHTLAQEWAQISAEELILQNPDVILLGSAAYGTTVESVPQRAGWAAIAAVQRNAVFPVDDIIVTRPGPRLVDALEMLANILHPELFQ